MWHLFQFTIIMSVIGSNIHWHWAGPHDATPIIMGVGLAYCLTDAISEIGEILRARRAKRPPPPSPDEIEFYRRAQAAFQFFKRVEARQNAADDSELNGHPVTYESQEAALEPRGS